MITRRGYLLFSRVIAIGLSYPELRIRAKPYPLGSDPGIWATQLLAFTRMIRKQFQWVTMLAAGNNDIVHNTDISGIDQPFHLLRWRLVWMLPKGATSTVAPGVGGPYVDALLGIDRLL